MGWPSGQRAVKAAAVAPVVGGAELGHQLQHGGFVGLELVNGSTAAKSFWNSCSCWAWCSGSAWASFSILGGS